MSLKEKNDKLLKKSLKKLLEFNKIEDGDIQESCDENYQYYQYYNAGIEHANRDAEEVIRKLVNKIAKLEQQVWDNI
jgi:hypothetical protein